MFHFRLKKVQEHYHGVDPDDWKTKYDLVTTNGSQDGLSKSLEMLTNPGDSLVVEDHSFFSTFSILDPHGARYIPVDGDNEGIRPDSLWGALSSNWRPGEPGAPKYIYTNPTGSNPTGTVLPAERKREIYQICSEYDMVIMEDDPYYYMQFLEPGEERSPSFLSLDTDGRVLRFDSFSKMMSSGIRLGWVTGPKELVDKVVLHLQVSALHASSLSQVKGKLNIS